MDKTGNSQIPASPAAWVNRQDSPLRTSPGQQAADSSRARSFDLALDRMRERTAARQQALEKTPLPVTTEQHQTAEPGAPAVAGESDVPPIDMPPDMPPIDGLQIDGPQLQSVFERSSDANSEEHNPGSATGPAQSCVHRYDAQLLQSHQDTDTVASVEPGQAPSGTSASMEAPAPVSVPPGDTSRHGVSTAESIASMMKRLERTAGSHDGQWRFAVLDNPMGLTSLHMQRSAQGTWRVGVSLNQSAALDEPAQAEQLRAALQSQGHTVDTVTISRSSSGPVDNVDHS